MDRFLTLKGFAVRTAQNGEQALKILDKEKIDLLILDKKMQWLSGEDVIKILLEKGSKIPVMLVSGSQTLSAYTQELRKTGRISVLCKPMDLTLLLETCNKKIKEAQSA